MQRYLTYTGTKKVKSVKAVKKTYKMAAEATQEDLGKLICAAGHIHAVSEGAVCKAERVAIKRRLATRRRPRSDGFAIRLP